MSPVNPEDRQRRMIHEQIRTRGIVDERVLEAIQAVPRDRFVPPEIDQMSWDDRALPIGHDQTISQPYIVALMTEALDLSPEHRVLEIGFGSGYQTAILSRLCGHVFAVERIAALAAGARARLGDLGVTNVTLRTADGSDGWPEEAPFDRVLIAAAPTRVPETLLLRQLRVGGIAVLPAGPTELQELLQLRRTPDGLTRTKLCDCRFVPLVSDPPR